MFIRIGYLFAPRDTRKLKYLAQTQKPLLRRKKRATNNDKSLCLRIPCAKFPLYRQDANRPRFVKVSFHF